jgi:hypothetical protein
VKCAPGGSRTKAWSRRGTSPEVSFPSPRPRGSGLPLATRNIKMRIVTIVLAILLLIMFAQLSYAQETPKPANRIRTQKELAEYRACRSIKDTDLKDDKAPTFENYRVAVEALVRHPRVDTKTAVIGRRYRTVLRNGIKSGANFAGHYAVVNWGCGTSCSSFAVVNLKTGKVITPGGISAVSGDHLDSSVDEKFLPDGLQLGWGYRFRLDSRLLVLVGALNEDEAWEGAYYFLLEKDQLKPIHRTRVEKKCDR